LYQPTKHTPHHGAHLAALQHTACATTTRINTLIKILNTDKKKAVACFVFPFVNHLLAMVKNYAILCRCK
jgi:hypothetical protein